MGCLVARVGGAVLLCGVVGVGACGEGERGGAGGSGASAARGGGSQPASVSSKAKASLAYLQDVTAAILQEQYSWKLNGFWGGQGPGQVNVDGPEDVPFPVETILGTLAKKHGGVDPLILDYYALLAAVNHSYQGELSRMSRRGAEIVLDVIEQDLDPDEEYEGPDPMNEGFLDAAVAYLGHRTRVGILQVIVDASREAFFEEMERRYSAGDVAAFQEEMNRPWNRAWVEGELESMFSAEFLSRVGTIPASRPADLPALRSAETIEEVEEILRRGGPESEDDAARMLRRSCNAGREFELRLQLAWGVDPNSAYRGMTALGTVAGQGGLVNLKLAKVLVEAGADPLIVDFRGDSAMSKAVGWDRACDPVMVRLLAQAASATGDQHFDAGLWDGLAGGGELRTDGVYVEVPSDADATRRRVVRFFADGLVAVNMVAMEEYSDRQLLDMCGGAKFPNSAHFSCSGGRVLYDGSVGGAGACAMSASDNGLEVRVQGDVVRYAFRPAAYEGEVVGPGAPSTWYDYQAVVKSDVFKTFRFLRFFPDGEVMWYDVDRYAPISDRRPRRSEPPRGSYSVEDGVVTVRLFGEAGEIVCRGRVVGEGQRWLDLEWEGEGGEVVSRRFTAFVW